MPTLKSKKTKAQIKNLGSGAGKVIGAAGAKSIRGGNMFGCMSTDCSSLKVVAAKSTSVKMHKPIIKPSF